MSDSTRDPWRNAVRTAWSSLLKTKTACKTLLRSLSKTACEVALTARSTSETTDTSSKRYVIQNTTDELLNYELRRKMRKVGVQVQDSGVALGWHTFVDDPGRDLGVGKLVHLGEPPELSDLVQPDAPPIPTATLQEVRLSIPFVGKNTDDTDTAYTTGEETESGPLDITEYIEADFAQGSELLRARRRLRDHRRPRPVATVMSEAGSGTGANS